MSQLGLGLGLSNVSSLLRFSPLDLDPYLLFDTQSSMIGTFENPTLDLDPANPSTLDVITATRAGVATYTDADGLIQSAAPNTTRVDQTQGAELTPTVFQRVGYTDFSSGWSAANATLTPNVAASPFSSDGAARVQSLNFPDSRITHYISNGPSQFVYSAYFKWDGNDTRVNLTAAMANGSVQFDVTEAGLSYVSGTPDSYEFTSVGNGWTRVSIFIDATTVSQVRIQPDGTGGNGSVLVAAPQLVDGDTQYDFVANTTGSPKFITGATYGPRVPMILVEPSSENLVTNSSSFSALSGATLTSGIDAPDNNNDAKRISNAQIVNTTFAKCLTISIPTGVAADYVGSVYVRGTAGETVNVFMKRASGGPFVSSGSRSVLLTGEWQRVENIALTSDPANSNMAIYLSSAGETVDSIDLWGGQIESGSVSTSVIPTSGSPVTRVADDLVISGSDFDFYNQSEGTFFVEFQTKDATAFYYLLNSQSDQARFFYSNGGTNTINSFDGTEVTALTNLQDNTLSRVALSIKASEFRASKDGSSEDVASHNGNLLTVPTELRIGKSPYNGVPLQLNGHIKRLIYWPYSSDRL